MVLEAKAYFRKYKFKVKNGKEYERFSIFLPPMLYRDSQFPFKPDQPVTIKIDLEKKRLIIESGGDC